MDKPVKYIRENLQGPNIIYKIAPALTTEED
jgi:hypothetical protein